MDSNLIEGVRLKSYWHVIYVRQKYERAISSRLDELGVENLLPLAKTVRLYKSQKRKVVVPMFPGYVFLKVRPGTRHHVTNLNGVYSFVKIGREFQYVKDWEIENIRILTSNMDNCRDFRSEEYIGRGSFVQVKNGPLSGMRGFVTGTNGGRILVCIESIRTAISISVPQSQVEVSMA